MIKSWPCSLLSFFENEVDVTCSSRQDVLGRDVDSFKLEMNRINHLNQENQPAFEERRGYCSCTRGRSLLNRWSEQSERHWSSSYIGFYVGWPVYGSSNEIQGRFSDRCRHCHVSLGDFRPVYKAFVRPHLRCRVQAWLPYFHENEDSREGAPSSHTHEGRLKTRGHWTVVHGFGLVLIWMSIGSDVSAWGVQGSYTPKWNSSRKTPAAEPEKIEGNLWSAAQGWRLQRNSSATDWKVDGLFCLDIPLGHMYSNWLG